MSKFICLSFLLLPILISATNQDSIVFTHIATGQSYTIQKGDKIILKYSDSNGRSRKIKGYFIALTEKSIAINRKKNLEKVVGHSILIENIVSFKLSDSQTIAEETGMILIIALVTVLLIILIALLFFILAYGGYLNHSIWSLVLILSWGLTIFSAIKLGVKVKSKSYISVDSKDWIIDYYRNTDNYGTSFKP